MIKIHVTVFSKWVKIRKIAKDRGYKLNQYELFKNGLRVPRKLLNSWLEKIDVLKF